MYPSTRITFYVNTPLCIEINYKQFRKMEDIEKLDESTAMMVWNVLVKKAGMEKSITTDSTMSFTEDASSDAFAEVEYFVSESVEDAIAEVNGEGDSAEKQAEYEAMMTAYETRMSARGVANVK